MHALSQIDGWPVGAAAAGVATRDGAVAAHGDAGRVFRWASVTKLATALAVLLAAEEGTLDLDEPAGPEGSTVRHLLAHASGLPFEGEVPLARPGERRIYSNTGIEAAAALVERRAEMPFADYLAAGVFGPLGVEARLEGSPAEGISGSLDDLLRVAAELLAPTVVTPETLHEATQVAFPGLVGVLPGFGRQEPNDWGLGFELRDGKHPHWTGSRNAPGTFGHFGRSGSFLWVDPEAGLACCSLGDRDFCDWAREAWPALADAVLAETGR